MSSISIPDSDAVMYRVRKKAMSRLVREEIRRQCTIARVKWPKEFFVSIRADMVRFYDLDMQYLIGMTDCDHGFDATRAYLLLLCKGCPASGEEVAPDESDEDCR
jgi:hypothetical protein